MTSFVPLVDNFSQGRTAELLRDQLIRKFMQEECWGGSSTYVFDEGSIWVTCSAYEDSGRPFVNVAFSEICNLVGNSGKSVYEFVAGWKFWQVYI